MYYVMYPCVITHVLLEMSAPRQVILTSSHHYRWQGANLIVRLAMTHPSCLELECTQFLLYTVSVPHISIS
jgi:hypothetical protein